jgi:PAS domain S-box-containing protein
MPDMADAEKKGDKRQVGLDFRHFGAVSLFVFINGFVVAAIVFAFLFRETGNQNTVEARNLTRDIVRITEESLSDTEKTVRSLTYFYSTMRRESDDAEGSVNHNAQKLLIGESMPTSVLWVTEKGGYHQESFIGKEERNAYDPTSGWPSFQELYRETYDLHFNEIEYWGRLHWPAFKVASMDRAEQPVGLVTKVRIKNGETGILLVVTMPSRIFGSGWATQRENIARITISDHETGNTVVDNRTPWGRDGAGGFFSSPVPTDYVLQMGNKYWDMHFQVLPTVAARLLTMAPWAALILISLLTLLAGIVSERKHRQDRRLAEMSETLAGAHHQLQAKTSERDQLFYALRKSEREYKAVINSVSDVIFETDETGRLIFLNETWLRVAEKDNLDFVGRLLFDAIVPADRHKQQEMFDALVRGERQAYRTETYLDLGQGRTRAAEIAFSMLRMTEDKSLRVVGTITDIEKRQSAENAMREAEQRFRAIFENSISGIYQTSPDGRFISANPALAEIFGYDSTDDLVRSVIDVSRQIYVDAQDRASFLQKLLFEGRVSGIESEVYRKDGTKIWIMENARVVRSAKGGILYYEGSIWDVTERKEAEESMRQSRVQAEISSRARLEFLANMSHELRTPLNAVIGFSEIIKDELMGPHSVPVYKEYATDIYESGNYLLKVISEILEVSKIETGDRELNQSNFHLMKVLKSCMTILSARIVQSDVRVNLDLPEDLPEILAEELGFKQILLNLIGNAVKFTGKGACVTISAQIEENGEMTISVADEGIGMTEAEIKKAMQPFGKVDNNLSTMKEGTGLGLTIVEALVRLHGAEFKLTSQKGVGTTAKIILPAYRVLHQSNVTPIKAGK